MYITSNEVIQQFTKSKHVTSAHWIDLPGTEVLVAAAFKTPQREQQFRTHPATTAFPHPMSGEAVGQTIAAKLAYLGVLETDTTWQAAKKIAKSHPLITL